MFAAFWFLLVLIARSFCAARRTARPFVLAGCAALAVGTLQGPVQAFPAVNELLDRGGDAGDVIVNLHAQLNMLGGLMVHAHRRAFARAARARRRAASARRARSRCARSSAGMALYYAGGICVRRVRGASRVATAAASRPRSRALEPWPALVLVPAALSRCCRASPRSRARRGR